MESIPPERMNGIPSIGINIHTEGTERYEDVEMDILSGKVIDLEVLDYVPDITDDPKAIEVIAELIDKLPDIEVRGSLEKWQAAILASQIDQLSYDYDTYQYQDTVEDREAQVANITEDIRNGNTGYLNDFLNAVISRRHQRGRYGHLRRGCGKLMTAKRFRQREGQRSCLTSWQNTSRLQRLRSLKNRITT